MAAQDETIQAGHHEKHFALESTIPAGALAADTSLKAVCREPSAFAGTLGSLDSIEAFVDLDLQSGQTNFANGRRADLSFEYKDDDGDGIVDGYGIPEGDLKVFWLNAGTWQSLPDSVVDPVLNTVTCTTDHFSTFAVLSEPNAVRDWSIYE